MARHQVDDDRHQRRRRCSRSRSRRRSHSRSPPRQRRRHSSSGQSPPPFSSKTLPAAAHRDELVAAVRDHQIVICVGETGSGKTTQIPQYLHAEIASITRTHRIVVTQPRRVATVSVAQRVAEEMGFPRVDAPRSPVGYTIRFDDQTSAATKIKFVTDGILVRECLADPSLQQYGVVMLDEAHERSLHTDILLGLLKRVLADRSDLKLVVTSATLDADRFAAYFASDATSALPPIIRIPGRSYPVDIFHSRQTQIMGLRGPLSPYVRAAVETTMQIHHSEPSGHILVFLTGQHEIQDACNQIRRMARESPAKSRDSMELKVLPLYGALSASSQREIFADLPSHVRKVIVATNIAETSLTIDGIRYVVDSGFTKQKVYNPEKQIESLVVVPISQVAAQQRAGRAGRTRPGKCFRLYSKESYSQMLEETIPEIQRTNLANTVLYLKVLGIHDVLNFRFLDPPAEDSLLDALYQLFTLGAIGRDGKVTVLGKLMSHFPLEPKLARAFVEAIILQCSDDMAAIVAMLSVESVFVETAVQKHEQDNDDSGSRDTVFLRLVKEDLVDDKGDHLTYLRLLRAFEKQPARERHAWSEDRELRFRALSTASSIKKQLLDITSALPASDLENLREQQTTQEWAGRSRTTRLRRAVCAGFFLHAARRCTTQSSVYRPFSWNDEDTSGRGVQLLHLHPTSALNYVPPPTQCVYHELVATSRPYMRSVLAVEESWVSAFAAGRIKISRSELFALSGVITTDDDVRASPTTSLAQPPASNPVETSEPLETTREDAIAAARARFLARKRG